MSDWNSNLRPAYHCEPLDGDWEMVVMGHLDSPLARVLGHQVFVEDTGIAALNRTIAQTAINAESRRASSR